MEMTIDEVIKALKWFLEYNEEDYYVGDRFQDKYGDWFYKVSERDFKAFKMAIKALEQEPTSYQWCTDCKEYDQEKHCCHRWSKVIRDTVEEIKQEQEPIKALGEELRKVREGIKDGIVLYGYDKAVAICDKYLSETEADNGNDNR